MGNPELSALSREKSAVLKEAIAGLSERERTILDAASRAPPPGCRDRPYRRVSESRVSQLLASIRQKLKSQLEDYDGVRLDTAA